MSATTTSSDRDRIDRMAMALRRVAHDADVALPIPYAPLAATAEREAELGAPRLGSRIVVRAVSAAKERFRVLAGYADRRVRSCRDGSRHVETPAADDPVEDMEMGL